MSDADPFRESRLPKWAQDLLTNLRSTVAAQEEELAAIRVALGALNNNNWTMKGNVNLGPEHPRVSLYYFAPNSAVRVCELGPDDVILVGRDRKVWDEQETQRRYDLAKGKAGASGKKADKPL